MIADQRNFIWHLRIPLRARTDGRFMSPRKHVFTRAAVCPKHGQLEGTDYTCTEGKP